MIPSKSSQPCRFFCPGEAETAGALIDIKSAAAGGGGASDSTRHFDHGGTSVARSFHPTLQVNL
jgi:hypothetical protein